jgi:mono/diheme cytochrome c family protein
MPDFGPGTRKTIVILAALLTAAILVLLSDIAPAMVQAQQTSDTSAPRVAAPNQNQYIGNESCGGCHGEIYKSYLSTAMARASGPATQNLITGKFHHQPSGVRYRVYQEDGDA